MGVVQREEAWCLERSSEGVYLITHRGRVRRKLITGDHRPRGVSDDGSDHSVPVREVSSVAEAEQVFTSVASGDAFVPVPAGITRSWEGDPPDILPDLPVCGIAFVWVLAGSCFAALAAATLHPVAIAVGLGVLLIGAVASGVAYRECRRHGPRAAVYGLCSLESPGEESGVEELAE
jgi:hypothetical protein